MHTSVRRVRDREFRINLGAKEPVNEVEDLSYWVKYWTEESIVCWKDEPFHFYWRKSAIIIDIFVFRKLKTGLTRFGTSQTIDGFQINNIYITMAQTDNSSFIHRHSFYLPFRVDRSEKKMCRHNISFFQTFHGVDVQCRMFITTVLYCGYNDVIGIYSRNYTVETGWMDGCECHVGMFQTPRPVS